MNANRIPRTPAPTAVTWPMAWSGREQSRAEAAATGPMWTAAKPRKATPAPVPTEGARTYRTDTMAVPTRVVGYAGVALLLLVFILGAMMDHTVWGTGTSAMPTKGATATDTRDGSTTPGRHRAPTADETAALATARQTSGSPACWFEWEGDAYGVYDIICAPKPKG